MFKIGDIVEITEESASTGMLDFENGRAYEVIGASRTGHKVLVIDEGGRAGWYHCAHFKLKEDTLVQNKECLFKEGQVVWDTSYGRGAVSAVFPPSQTTSGQVQVEFDSTKGSKVWYTLDGKYQLEKGATHRTLFFSEPKIEAATEPVFEPTLKEGDVVIALDAEEYRVIYIKAEEYDRLVDYNGSCYYKIDWEFYILGEKINFK